MTSDRFDVPYKNHLLIGDLVPGGQTPSVLMLHGAGQSVRTRYRPLQDHLSSIGITSACFDNDGHGDTGGELESSSLADRTHQAETVIKYLGFKEPLGLVGGSMGAYTAIKLTEIYQVDKLLLIVPGIYAADAYTLPFNNEFTQRIRQSESWRKTDAWEILSRFTGDLLIITAEYDTVIPKDIPTKLCDSAINARSRDIYEIPTAPHKIMNYLNQIENATLLKEYLTRIEQFYGHLTMDTSTHGHLTSV